MDLELVPINPSAEFPDVFARAQAAAKLLTSSPAVDIPPGANQPKPHQPGEDPEANAKAGKLVVPDGIIPTPGGGVSNIAAGAIIFRVLGAERNLFQRGGCLCEVVGGEIKHVSPERFCSVVEKYGRVARREVNDGKIVWRSTTMPKSSAGILLASPELSHLPPLRQISNCAIITKDCQILGAGYHDHGGGTYISTTFSPAKIPLDTSIAALGEILCDFDFTTPADESRAIASLLSPALKKGGWLSPNANFPLDLAEADQSQSGKTFRQMIVCALYGEKFKAISAPKGGVGSLDENLGTALLGGRPFISLDNFRGRIDSTVMESAITGEEIQARGFAKAGTVDCRPFLWQISTNGAEFTRDLANRSIITRIRKRHENYRFRKYEEGSVMDHLRANEAFYLGAVFTVLEAWAKQGYPRTEESRHDFREWCQSLDWIIQNIFGMAPLLDGHKDEQLRTANPSLTWVREVALAVILTGQSGQDLTTSDLVIIADEADIEFPGNRSSRDEPAQRAGKILGKLFREANRDVLVVGDLSISRQERHHWTDSRGSETTKFYTINRH